MLPVAEPACAVHPAQTAELTCERCGAFACLACRSVSRSGICVACDWRATPGGVRLSATALILDSFDLAYRCRWQLGVLAAGVALGLTKSWSLTTGNRLSLLWAFVGVSLVLMACAGLLLSVTALTGLALNGIASQVLNHALGAPVVALPVGVWLALTGRRESAPLA